MESENIDDTKNSNMNLPVNVNLSSPVLRYFSKKKNSKNFRNQSEIHKVACIFRPQINFSLKILHNHKSKYQITMYLPKYLVYNTSNIFFGREWISKRREEIRPWTSFVKTSNFEVPASLPKVTKRFYKNIEYFQSNYVSFKIII